MEKLKLFINLMLLSKNFFGVKYSRFLKYKKKNILTNRFASGSNYKFSKFHKIIDNYTGKRSFPYSMLSNSNLSSGLFTQVVIKSPYFGYLSDFQIKSFKNLFKKPYKKLFKPNFQSYFGITKKPSEVRMGKGKSSKIVYRSFPFRSGRLLGVSFRRSNSIITDFRLLAKFKFYFSKFPIRFKLLVGGF